LKNIKDIKQLIAIMADEFSDDESINKHKLEQMVWDSLLGDEQNRNDYLEVLAFEALKGETGKHFNKHVKAVKGTNIAQFEFMNAGFKHIQSRYAITVNGETEIIPTNMMSGLQFDQQISLHTKQGNGHLQHADELSRLKVMIHGNIDPSANDPEFFDTDG
jgi:hypothetical protein